MTRTTPILRQPYRRRSTAEWDEIRRLYRAGASARARVKAWGGTGRTLQARARRDGWLRKSMPEDIAGLTGGQVIPEDLGIKLEQVTLDMPGKARKVTIT